MNDIATPDTANVDEFLGTTTRPRWRRWAKFWVPGAIVLLVLICASTWPRATRSFTST